MQMYRISFVAHRLICINACQNTLAYVSGLPQGLRGEEILDGGGGKRNEVSIPSLYLLFAFLFSFPPETPYNQARYTLLSSKV